MIEKLFTSEVRVNLLELFLFNPDTEFHLRDVARRINAVPIHVRNELNNLEELGLITHKKKGNMILFKSNTKATIYDDLKKLFLKTRSFGSALSKKIKDNSDIKYAIIYGSFAHGKETKTSDVDLLVVGSISENVLYSVVREFEERTGREMNYILWTVEEFEEKVKDGISLLADIAEDGIIMLKGDEDEFRRTVKTG